MKTSPSARTMSQATGSDATPFARGPIRYLPLLCLMLICLSFATRPAMAIIGGTNADWSAYRWLVKNVALYPGQTQWADRGCSSVIIDEFHALTAAHCLNGPYPYEVGIMFSDGEVIQVVQEIRHPSYMRDSAKLKDVFGIVSESIADIGLQRLAKPVGIANGKNIHNIFNNNLPADITGDLATVLGWGSTDQPFPAPITFSPTLQQIQEVVQDNGLCQSALDTYFENAGVVAGSPFRLTDSLFCASPVGRGLNPDPFTNLPALGVCSGDSGPLFTMNGNEPQLLGFVTDYLSFSLQRQCGSSVDIYTKLTPAYLEWIKSVVLFPTDVTAQFSVTTSGFVYSPVTKLYSGAIKVVNNGAVVNGPLSMLLTNLTPGVTVVSPAGSFGGDPYLAITTGITGINSGQSITVPVRFNNPSNSVIRMTLKIYTGASN
jgi:hypothetical protein